MRVPSTTQGASAMPEANAIGQPRQAQRRRRECEAAQEAPNETPPAPPRKRRWGFIVLVLLSLELQCRTQGRGNTVTFAHGVQHYHPLDDLSINSAIKIPLPCSDNPWPAHLQSCCCASAAACCARGKQHLDGELPCTHPSDRGCQLTRVPCRGADLHA